MIEKETLVDIVDDEWSGELYAAVDLGSNSFHMLIASHRDGKFEVLDRHPEVVRLASGIDEARLADCNSC